MSFLLALAVVAAPAGNTPQQGFSTAVQACESWIMNPATWADHIEQFPQSAGLDGKLEPQSEVPEVLLPPQELRRALHSWRIPVGDGGVFLTVSDRIPFCHIAGGGAQDFQPGVEAALQSMIATKAWRKTGERRQEDMLSTNLASAKYKKLSMVVSRAASPGKATDRVQLLATARYEIQK